RSKNSRHRLSSYDVPRENRAAHPLVVTGSDNGKPIGVGSAVIHDVTGFAHDLGIGRTHHGVVLVRVVELGQHVTHGFQASALLVVGLDHGPRCVTGVRVEEHGFLGLGVVIPFVQGGNVSG